MQKVITKQIDLEDGRTITIETGKLAKQADGSVVVRMGDTMLLATVVAAEDARDNVDFMPLSVDYQEKFASVGRFPGGFLKREGRPSEHEILISRLVDRALRPLFPDDFHAEVFVSIYLISADKDIMPDALAGLAASAALAVSTIPFNGPISEARVSRINGEYVINPTLTANEDADIDIIVAATKDNILMVEGEMEEVSETEMLEAIKIGHEAIKTQCRIQEELAEETGSIEKREYCHEISNEKLEEDVHNFCYEKLHAIASQFLSKEDRVKNNNAVRDSFKESIPEEELDEDKEVLIDRYFQKTLKKVVRTMVLKERVRVDGRQLDQIRPIWCEVDYLPAAHGSAIFTRGETQSLTTITLGSKMDEKIIDDALEQGRNKFLLHYNFPPFSTGDARPVRGVSRREVGHGNLAHRALKRQVPNEKEGNPYAIRLVSDILESNGSSSMATVCAGTMALMDSGIKMKKAVSGIAMGLITEGTDYAILSDILGDEDHLGDMDFKVTGTKDGITACQMDIKVDGLSYDILKEALEQARKGRLHILDKLLETIPQPREDYKPHAPRIETLYVPRESIGAIIGPGGKIIQQIQSDTDSIIAIEEDDKQGIVTVSAQNKASIDAAVEKIRGIVAVPELGEVYEGKVKSITKFGAFIEILPGKEGLLHVTEIAHGYVKNVEDVLEVGETVKVKLINVDERSGKLKLSRKVLLPQKQQKQGGRKPPHHRHHSRRN